MRILITGATGLIGSSLTAGCWRFLTTLRC